MAGRKKLDAPTPEHSGATHARKSRVKRDPRGRWLPGASACPGGPGPGYKWKQTRLAEGLLLDKAAEISTKALELALSGNPLVMKLVLERLVPVARDRPVRLNLPKVTSAE